MDTKTIFVLTAKGQEEVTHKTSLLYGDIKRALSMVDGVSTFTEISKRAAPSLRSILAELIRELVTGGFIEDKARAGFSAKIVVPTKVSAPTAKQEVTSESELDFTTIMRAPSADALRAEAAKIQATQKSKQDEEAATKLKAEEEVKPKAEQEAKRKAEEEAKLKAEQEAKRKAEEEAKLKAEQEAKRKAEEEAKLKAEQEAKRKAEEEAKLKAEQEAKRKAEEEAKLKAEQEAKRKAEEEAKLKAEQEAKRKAEEEAKLKAEQEAKRKAEEEAKLKAEQEAKRKAEEEAKLKAEQEAKRKAEEEAKLKAEQEAKRKAEEEAKLKAEQEAKRKAEEEAKVRAEKEEAERKARAQAESARLKAEQDAEAARKEAEVAKKKADEEAQARAAAERKALEAAESAKQQAERLAAEAKAEAERIKKEAEQAAEQAKAETERVKREAEELARKAREEAEASRVKAEQEAARIRDELEATRMKAEQDHKARQEAEAARIAAEVAAAEARKLAEKISAQEREELERALEHKAALEREEEIKRAKQHALAAASTQIRETPYDTSKPPEADTVIKLDDFDLDALEIKPLVTAASVASVQAVQEAHKGPSTEEIKAKELAAKEQAKQAKIAKLAEEAAAKKLADTQAKAWAEAELRAADAAKKHATQAAHQAVHSAELKQQTASKLKAATKPKRKPLPWGGISVGLLLLAVLSLFVIPMTLPTQEYASKLEKQLSEELHQPVHIGKLAVRILPTPRIDLGEVYIGEIKQIKAQQAILSIGFGALFGDVKSVDEMQLEGAELNGTGLLDVPGWLQSISADKQHPIARITFNGAKLNGDAIQLNDLAGAIIFDVQGHFASSEMRANGGKFVLNIKAAPDGKLETVFNLHGTPLPLLPNWNFEDMTANGVLTTDGLVVNDFDARIAGGILQGTARLDWKAGWSAQGNLNAKTLTLSTISKLLEGDMDGEGRFKMQADALAKLTESSALDGTIVVKKGVINGVNIIETARLHSKENIPGGRSHFDQMEGALSYSNGVYHFKSLKITSSVLNATGSVDIAKQQLSGRITARLSIDGVSNVDLQVGGATDNPTLRATR